MVKKKYGLNQTSAQEIKSVSTMYFIGSVLVLHTLTIKLNLMQFNPRLITDKKTLKKNLF